jgi:acetyl-CoA synthetase
MFSIFMKVTILVYRGSGVDYRLRTALTSPESANIIDEAEFDANRWYSLLETHKINIYTLPRLSGDDAYGYKTKKVYNLENLRLILSVANHFVMPKP